MLSENLFRPDSRRLFDFQVPQPIDGIQRFPDPLPRHGENTPSNPLKIRGNTEFVPSDNAILRRGKKKVFR